MKIPELIRMLEGMEQNQPGQSLALIIYDREDVKEHAHRLLSDDEADIVLEKLNDDLPEIMSTEWVIAARDYAQELDKR